MLCSERNKIRFGLHKCLGSRGPCWAQSETKSGQAFLSASAPVVPMLCPDRCACRMQVALEDHNASCLLIWRNALQVNCSARHGFSFN